MSTVTGLEPDPRRNGRVRLEVDGKVYCTLTVEQVATHHLVPGRVIDEPLQEFLQQAADADAALRALLRALERRSFSRQDLARRLRQRGHTPAAVAAGLERADQLGLIDDAAYALNFVATRAARGRGPARLRRDLQLSGVARHLIEAALEAQWPDGADASASVTSLVARRVQQLKSLPRVVRRRRILAFLARRGFAGADVRQVVDRLIA